MKLKVVALAVAGLLSIFVVACGGSDSGSEPETSGSNQVEKQTSLTKAELIAKADELCSEASDSLDGLEEKANAASAKNDYGGVAEVYETLGKRATELSHQLRSLEYNGQDAGTFDAYVSTSEKQFEKVKGLPQALRDADFGEIAKLGAEIENLGGKAEALARKIGLKKCSNED